MGALRKFFGSRDDVPDWARFFDAAGYRHFLLKIRALMESRRWPYEMGSGVVRVRPPGRQAMVCGLANLAQVCNQVAQSDWPAIIANHFDAFFADDPVNLDRIAADFEVARRLMKVRLYPGDYTDAVPPDVLVSRSSVPGIVEVLVYDLPNTVATVHPDHSRKWGRTDDELFDIGLANIRSEGPLVAHVKDLEQGATLTALIGDSFFAASHALFLRDYLERDAPYGTLVTIPHRHAILHHVIRDMRVMVAIHAMIPITFGMFKEGPGSVSENLYWLRDGKFEMLPSKVSAKAIHFSPTDGFVGLLDRLPEV